MSHFNLSFLAILATLLLLGHDISATQTSLTQQPMNQEEQPSLQASPIQGTSSYSSTFGSSTGLGSDSNELDTPTNEGTPSFGSPTGFGSASNNLRTPTNEGTPFGDSSEDQAQLSSPAGYQQPQQQQQQQLGYQQQGTNQPFSAFSANNNNNNNNNNQRFSPSSQLPFAVNNQRGSANANPFYNGAVGKNNLEPAMLASLLMNLMLVLAVLLP